MEGPGGPYHAGLAPAPMPTGQQANQVLAQQDHYLREQDAALGTISDQLGRLRVMGRQIGGELGDQVSASPSFHPVRGVPRAELWALRFASV